MRFHCTETGKVYIVYRFSLDILNKLKPRSLLLKMSSIVLSASETIALCRKVHPVMSSNNKNISQAQSHGSSHSN